MSCQVNFNYPSDFYPDLFSRDGVPCIAAAYVAYYTAVYGSDVSSWPAGAQSQYASYAPFTLPTDYTFLETVYINDGVFSPDDIPIGYWASDSWGFLNLVFRGTEGDIEWALDGSITQAANTITNGQGLPQGCVESGFQAAYDNLTESITSQYNALVAQGYGASGLYIFGHSLGAALANLAAMDLSSETGNITMYTIGCPRTGSTDFANTLDTLVPNNFRITSGWDIVPDMPPVMIAPFGDQSVYTHAGGQCPVYTSETDFVAALFGTPPDPLYGHHLSTYNQGITNLINSGVSFAESPKKATAKA